MLYKAIRRISSSLLHPKTVGVLEVRIRIYTKENIPYAILVTTVFIKFIL